jgi:hypothetical protein
MGGDAFEDLQRQLLEGVGRYHLTGELDYMPIVTPEGKDAYLAGIEPNPTEPADWMGTRAGLLIAGADDVYTPRVQGSSVRGMPNAAT